MRISWRLIVATGAVAMSLSTVLAEPVSTAFIYQGQLKKGGGPLNEPADISFALWDAADGGNPVAAPLVFLAVDVSNGLFAQEIDFGAKAYGSVARWLEVAVRSPVGIGGFTTLSPRQRITGAPFSVQTRGLFVDENGQVGIATAPAAKFHVAGQAPTSGAGSLSSAGAAVVGVGTDFEAELHVGDMLVVGIQVRLVTDITSDTTLTTDTAFDPPLTNSLYSYQPLIARFSYDADNPAMVVNANGDVAIGTSIPTAKLTVAGGIESTTGGFRFPDGSIQTTGATGDGHSLDAVDGDPADALFVDGDGGVGIGTVTPSAQLQIRKSSTSPADTIRLDAAPDENPRIAFTVNNQVGARIRLNDSGNDQLQFTVFDTLGGTPIDALCIATSGNIGIGVDDPQTLLALDIGSGNPVGITQSQVAGSSSMELTTSDGLGAQATRFLLRGNSDAGDVEFYNGARGAEVQTMIIDGATGNVGIGTSDPGYRLEVAGDCLIAGLLATGTLAVGIEIPSAKLHAEGFGMAIRGVSTTTAANSWGVEGEGVRFGVHGEATGGQGLDSYGVRGDADNADGYAGYFRNVVAGINPGGIAVFAESNSKGKDTATLRVNNTSGDGVAAYLTSSSELATVHMYQENRFLGQTGGVLHLRNGGEDADGTGGGYFIEAVNDDESDVQFRILTDGEAQSDVGFTTPAADFAEMLPAGADDLVPGDVLAIDSTGKLIRSTKAYQSTVVGVYSTKPGFVGGKPLEGAIEGTIPLAMIGIVPVKVSTENGPIQPGDMLVASSIAGHAMRASDEPPIGTVIGKALEPLTKQRGVIRLLLILQ